MRDDDFPIDWNLEPKIEEIRAALDEIKKQNEDGLKNLVQLAQSGSIASAVYLADIYYRGELSAEKISFSSPNLDEAIFWFEHAGKLGRPYANYISGHLYFKKKDYENAKLAYERSYNSGYMPAAYRLGVLYDGGFGVERDAVKAKDLYGLAAKKGHVMAMRQISRLYIRGKFGIILIPFGIISNIYVLFYLGYLLIKDKIFGIDNELLVY